MSLSEAIFSKDMKNMMKVMAIVTFVVATFFLIILGVTGLRTFILLFLLYFGPMYFIVDLFDFDDLEKMGLAIFLSLGIVPSLVYYISLLLGNLTYSIIITFFLLVGAWFAIKKFKK